jgi:hypothetical protein
LIDLESLFAARSDFNRVALLLKQVTADKKSVAIIINQEDSCGERVFHRQSEVRVTGS